MTSPSRGGFTFMEVLCMVLVVGVGMAGVVSLVIYGTSVASRVRGATLGMATAVSVAKDARPLLADGMAADWSYTDYAATFDDLSSEQTSLARGYINGFYVERRESSQPQDVIRTPGSTGRVYVRSARVAVDVYEAVNGRRVASFATRILRQRGRQ